MLRIGTNNKQKLFYEVYDHLAVNNILIATFQVIKMAITFALTKPESSDVNISSNLAPWALLINIMR